MALIAKSDFTTYVQFTSNIQDRLIDYHINRAEQMDFKPVVPDAFWTKINEGSPGPGTELTSFINTYIKPILVLSAYVRFLVEHGSNITQFGITHESHPDITQVTDKRRAEIRTQYQHDLNVYWTKFYNELEDNSYTFDSVVYDFDCVRKRKNPKITAV